MTSSQPSQSNEPTPEEIARVEAWQAARDAERKRAARLERERREQERKEQLQTAREAVASKFRGKRIAAVDPNLNDYAEVRGLTLTFDDGSSVALDIYSYGDGADLEIEWTEATPE